LILILQPVAALAQGPEVTYESLVIKPPQESCDDVALTPDGKLVITATDTIRLWSTDTGQQTAAWPKREWLEYQSLVISPDGKWLAAATQNRETGQGNRVTLWEVAGVKEIRSFSLPAIDGSPRGELAFSADSKQLAVATDKGTLLVWEIESGNQKHLRRPTRSWFGGDQQPPSYQYLAFSPDGKRLAVAEYDKLRFWDFQAGHFTDQAIDCHNNEITSVAFAVDGSVLACASLDILGETDLSLYDAATAKKSTTFQRDLTVHQVAFAPNGRWLATASRGADAIHVWDLQTRARVTTLRRKEGPFNLDGRGRSLHFSADSTVVCAWLGQEAVIWRLPAKLGEPSDDRTAIRPTCSISDAKAPFCGAAYLPSGDTIVAINQAGTIGLWEAATGKARGSMQSAASQLACLAIAPDGHTLAIGGCRRQGSLIELRGLPDGQVLQTLGRPAREVLALAFHPAGKLLALATDAGEIALVDVASGRYVGTLQERGAAVWGLQFSPDGKLLASCGGPFGADSPVILWDPTARSRLAELRAHQGPVYAVAFSPDGKRLATAGADQTVRLWDVPNHSLQQELKGAHRTLFSLAFLGQGDYLAAAGAENVIQIWDGKQGVLVRTLTGHRDYIQALAATPGGTRLVSASVDRTLKVWDLSALSTGEDSRPK
jgi:WD40 repeat protein